MRGRPGAWAVVGLALVASLLLLRYSGSEAGWWPWSERAEARERSGNALGAKDDAALIRELEERAVLRGLPGVEGEPSGEGVLTGRVLLHVPGAGPRPLPGVSVFVLAARGRRTAAGSGADDTSGLATKDTLETDSDGAFLFPALRARAGYALVVRHAPYRDVVKKGIVIARNQTTDLGEILLGAPTTLLGEVVDAAGRPVAGARVQVFADTSRPDRFDLRQGLFDLQAAVDPQAEALSQGDGCFAVKDLLPGRYVVRVTAAGYAAAFRPGVRVTVDERSGNVRVVLDPGAGWYGVVADEEGRGVAGARLVAVALPGERMQRVDRVDALAGPDGAYRLDTLVPGVRYFVEAWAEGHAPTGRVAVAEGIRQHDVALLKAGRVEGRVTDRVTGAGIPDAQVTLLAGQAATLSPVSDVTDQDGLYVLPHVSPGPLLLWSVKAAGYEPVGMDVGGLGGRRVLAGETTVLDASLPKGGTVGGRVTGTDGRGVAYATVALVDPKRRWEGEETAVTDPQGRYLVTGLRAGAWEVRVSAPGYAPLVGADEVKVVVPPDLQPVTHDLVLSTGAVLVGTVKTPDGAPAGGAHLEVSATGSAEVRARVRDLAAVTDAGGRFRLLGVPPGVDVVVSATHDLWVRGLHGPLRLSAGQEQECVIVLRAGATLPGRVVDAQSRPVEGARVRWGHLDPEQERATRDAFRADEVLGARVLRSDGDGQFLIERLEPGATLVKVEREGFADWYRRDLVVSGEGVQPILSVTLAGALAIKGRVLTEEGGVPIPGAWVYAEENTPGPSEPQDPGRVRALVATQTGPDGAYVLDRLPPGKCRVAVWLALGFQNQNRRDVVPGSTGVDFRLAATPPPVPPTR
jgi:protocatechuate 3,4-dioxygenase beta subunit